MEQLREWLQPALDRAGNTHTFEDVMAAVGRGDMQLWTGPKGAAVTVVQDFPQKRVLDVFLAGGELEQIKDFEESAAIWGAAQGCTEMRLLGRRGWARVLDGWQPLMTALVRSI